MNMNDISTAVIMGAIGGALFWQFIVTLCFGFTSSKDKLPYYMAGGIFTIGLKLIFIVEQAFNKLTYKKRIFTKKGKYRG